MGSFVDEINMRKIICGIYKITSPSGKFYIGQAIDIYRRWNEYKFLGKRRRQPKLYASFKKYGVENHKFEIICECEESQLNYIEMYLIRFYDICQTLHGLNLTEGGGGSSGYKHIEESKEKNRQAHLGEKNNFYGRHHTKESNEINRRKAIEREKNMSEEQKRNKSEKLKSYPAPNKGKTYRLPLDRKHKNRAPVIQYDLNGNEIKRYGAMWQVVEELNLKSNAAISMACNGKLKTAYGYVWKYENKEPKYKFISKPNNSKSVVQIDRENGNIIAEFISIKEAERKIGVSIYAAVKNKRQKTAGGYKWEYANSEKNAA